MADGLYWLIRDYYFKNNLGSGFINEFGTMFEAYFEELASNCKFKKWFFGSLHIDKFISGTHRAIFKDIINIETGEKL